MFIVFLEPSENDRAAIFNKMLHDKIDVSNKFENLVFFFHFHFACYAAKMLHIMLWERGEQYPFEPFKYTNMCGCKQQSYKKQKD